MSNPTLPAAPLPAVPAILWPVLQLKSYLPLLISWYLQDV